MPAYALPDLDYDYSALEPHISGRIMELHHTKHHAAYVKNANQALERLEGARQKDDFAALASLEKALAFNLSGHVLHSIFWKNLRPQGGGAPSGELARTIERDFGSLAQLRAQLTAAASTVMGSGWATLVWEPVAGRLLTCQVYDHQSNVGQGGVAILVIDAWEHAWYLQYEDRKAEFFEALWELWSWDDVAARLSAATRSP